MPPTFAKMPIVDSNTARVRAGERKEASWRSIWSRWPSYRWCPSRAPSSPGSFRASRFPRRCSFFWPGRCSALTGSAPFSLPTPSTCCPIWVSSSCSFSPATRYRRRTSPVRRGSAELLPGRSPSPSHSSSWPFGRRCRPSSWTAWPWSSRSLPRPWARFCPFCRSAASWARGWGTRSSPTAPGASCFPSSPWRFCSRPGPPGRQWSSSSRSSPSPWRPPPCRRSPSASAATCTGSSLPMPTPTRRWSSVR